MKKTRLAAVVLALACGACTQQATPADPTDQPADKYQEACRDRQTGNRRPDEDCDRHRPYAQPVYIPLGIYVPAVGSPFGTMPLTTPPPAARVNRAPAPAAGVSAKPRWVQPAVPGARPDPKPVVRPAAPPRPVAPPPRPIAPRVGR